MYGLPDSAVIGTIKRTEAYVRKSGHKHSPLFVEARYAGILTIFGWILQLGDLTRKRESKKEEAPKFTQFTPREEKAKKVRFRIVED